MANHNASPRRPPRIPVVRSLFAGFAMGVANVIPGVSGGTMIFILGVFEELVDAIRTAASLETAKLFFTGKFTAAFRRVNWRFLIPLAIGLGVALISAAKLFTWLLEVYPAYTFAAFLGLMIASVLLMGKRVEKWDFRAVLALILCALAAFAIVNMVPVTTPNTWWMLLIAGAIAVCAMILPGISGSFLLLIMGQYTVLWGTVAALPQSLFTVQGFGTLFWMCLGGVAGLIAFSHLLNYLFKHKRNVTTASLIGFMVGSLPRLWPWNTDTLVQIKDAAGNLTRFVLPEQQALYDAAVQGGASSETLEFAYALPKQFDGTFWFTVALIVAGGLLVAATEFIAAKSAPAAGQETD